MTDILAWLGTNELLIILAICILIFGASRIPQLARSLGSGIKEFKKASKDITDSIDDVTKEDIEPDDTPKEGNENVPKDD